MTSPVYQAPRPTLPSSSPHWTFLPQLLQKPRHRQAKSRSKRTWEWPGWAVNSPLPISRACTLSHPLYCLPEASLPERDALPFGVCLLHLGALQNLPWALTNSVLPWSITSYRQERPLPPLGWSSHSPFWAQPLSWHLPIKLYGQHLLCKLSRALLRPQASENEGISSQLVWLPFL